MDRIIFIDIDGPVINTPCYFLDPNCSLERSVMNTQALGFIQCLADLANAKIVTNTTHNTHEIEDLLTGAKRTIKDDLIQWGLKAESFHTNWRTSFPYSRDNLVGEFHTRRLRAINQWQEFAGDVDWICFDDEDFTNDPRLIRVGFDTGIDFDAFRKACKHWNLDMNRIIV